MDNINPLIQLKSVSKGFYTSKDRFEVLKNIDFNIYKAETIAVVGASGIGKSTLLHIIGTLDRPDMGTLEFNGKDIFSLTNNQLAFFRNRKIGFVFQFHHLLQGFTAMENVMIPCLINQETRKKAEKISLSILERVNLKQRLFHKVEELSGGEQQRVALARAIVLKPDLLLADEPTGNLDMKNSKEIHNLLIDLNREFNMTVIIVTHNNELAELMKRKVTIKENKIITI